MAVIDQVRSVLVGYAPAGIALVDECALEDLGIASLDLIDIAFSLEEMFGITLPLDVNSTDDSNPRTVAGLAAMVEYELSKQEPSTS